MIATDCSTCVDCKMCRNT